MAVYNFIFSPLFEWVFGFLHTTVESSEKRGKSYLNSRHTYSVAVDIV